MKTEVCPTPAYLRAEAAVLRLLGSLFAGEPNTEQLRVLAEMRVFAEMPIEGDRASIEAARSRADRALCADLDQEALSSEYLRLFVGLPAPLAPWWESGYFNDRGLAFQEQMMAVRAAYARYGLQSRAKNREPDDSLALELEFVARLASLAADAAEAGDEGRACVVLGDQKVFLSEHLSCWVRPWAHLVRRHGREGLYPALADLTACFVEEVGKAFGCVPAHRPVRVT